MRKLKITLKFGYLLRQFSKSDTARIAELEAKVHRLEKVVESEKQQNQELIQQIGLLVAAIENKEV